MGRYWSDEPESITIDLGGVTSPEQLRAILAKYFHTWPDSRGLSCAFSLADQECPYHVTFLSWAEFESQMPRYARRVKRTLDEYARWHPQALSVQYAPPELPVRSANRPQPQGGSPVDGSGSLKMVDRSTVQTSEGWKLLPPSGKLGDAMTDPSDRNCEAANPYRSPEAGFLAAKLKRLPAFLTGLIGLAIGAGFYLVLCGFLVVAILLDPAGSVGPTWRERLHIIGAAIFHSVPLVLWVVQRRNLYRLQPPVLWGLGAACWLLIPLSAIVMILRLGV